MTEPLLDLCRALSGYATHPPAGVNSWFSVYMWKLKNWNMFHIQTPHANNDKGYIYSCCCSTTSTDVDEIVSTDYFATVDWFCAFKIFVFVGYHLQLTIKCISSYCHNWYTFSYQGCSHLIITTSYIQLYNSYTYFLWWSIFCLVQWLLHTVFQYFWQA